MHFRSSIDRDRLVAMLGSSRHSALAELRRRIGPTSRTAAQRVIALACGSTLIGTSITLLVQADLGLPPYDVLSSGLGGLLGLTLGQSGWLIAGVLFLIASLLGRRPSPWGVAYILANGAAIDATSELVNRPDTMIGQVAFLATAVLLMAVGVNLVLYSGTTGGPFELLMQAAEDRGIGRTPTRYALDGGVLGLGVLLGGTFGVATFVHGATMGLALQVISQAFADHSAGRSGRLAAGAEVAGAAAPPFREPVEVGPAD
jgi:uncharacterized membrane protein YczE